MAEWVPPQVGGRAIRLSVAGTTVTVRSPLPAVVERVARYVGPWWDVAPGQATTGPVVTARLGGIEDLEREVAGGAWREVPYPRAATRYARLRAGTNVVAVTPTERLAFRYIPSTGRMEVHGPEPEALIRAGVRAARELVRAQLITAGWVVLHASAVVAADGRAVLVLGGRGAGKSTAAFTLASRGARLLGNDRVFARARGDGAVELAPWPSGAAVGLGLLGALGWTRIVRQRLPGGAEPHPSQDAKVTAAIAAGCTERLGADGRELKAHLRPHEFAEWFDVACASSGRVAAVFFPAVREGVVPGIDVGRRVAVSESDFMMGDQEDSYPDIFGLTDGQVGGTAHARAAVAAALGRLPTHAVILGHEPGANAAFLTSLLAKPAAAATRAVR